MCFSFRRALSSFSAIILSFSIQVEHFEYPSATSLKHPRAISQTFVPLSFALSLIFCFNSSVL
jgi:hypothetical protein